MKLPAFDRGAPCIYNTIRQRFASEKQVLAEKPSKSLKEILESDSNIFWYHVLSLIF